MASIVKRSGSNSRSIQFYESDGSCKLIRLGKVPQRAAEVVKIKVEALIAAKLTGGSLDDETSRWLRDRDDVIYEKLVRVGLVPPRTLPAEQLTLAQFIDQFIETRKKGSNAKGTITNLGQTRRLLIEFFGISQVLRTITPRKCDEWRIFLESKGHATATISRHVKRAREFLRAALRDKLITENPMADVKTGSQVNKNREYYITRAEIERIIAACPDAEWRLIVALGRYGGLRTPSETFALEWKKIDWEARKMRVKSPKTACHEGKEWRDVPIFPELRPHLEAVRKEADPEAVYVINRHRVGSRNLRTPLEKIMKRAGVASWPRLFQNMRSSRETELAQKYPLHVVTAWIGNSALVATQHYLQVTEEDFAKAAKDNAQVSEDESAQVERKGAA